MTLSWGVVPLLANVYTSTDEMVWFAVESALAAGQISHGDTVLVHVGAPDMGTGASTDVLRVVDVA